MQDLCGAPNQSFSFREPGCNVSPPSSNSYQEGLVQVNLGFSISFCHSAVTCGRERRQVLFPHTPKIREVADQVNIPSDPGQA